MTLHAIYENGVFRPMGEVAMPDRCEVELEVRPWSGGPQAPTLDDVYDILGRRHPTGEPDLAQRHDEHQP